MTNKQAAPRMVQPAYLSGFITLLLLFVVIRHQEAVSDSVGFQL